jgi:hypothetical protein
MLMRRIDQGPSHYEVELRQADQRTGTARRAVRRIQVNGIVPLKFGSVQAAQAHAERLRPKEARVVAVEHNGWRRMVDAAET